MLDIKFVRNNPDVVKENIKKKFQDEKLPLVDEVLELDQKNREIKQEVEALRADRNKISKEIGACMAQGKKEEAEELKKKVQENADRVESLSAEEKEVEIDFKQVLLCRAASVRDLWMHEDLGEMKSFHTMLPPHGCRVLKLSERS